MTVEELIAELQRFPPKMKVITNLHSEFAAVNCAYSMVGFDNGGYVSRPYGPEDKLRAHGYVYVGVSGVSEP